MHEVATRTAVLAPLQFDIVHYIEWSRAEGARHELGLGANIVDKIGDLHDLETGYGHGRSLKRSSPS